MRRSRPTGRNSRRTARKACWSATSSTIPPACRWCMDPLWRGAVFDNDAIVGALERQAPLWKPGHGCRLSHPHPGQHSGRDLPPRYRQAIPEVHRRRGHRPARRRLPVWRPLRRRSRALRNAGADRRGHAPRASRYRSRCADREGLHPVPRRADAGNAEFDRLAARRDHQRQRPWHGAHGGAYLRRGRARRRDSTAFA